eukprot:CAMPEP_0116892112 /NCGR_PEP_ID=MMETSP0467-20121206/2402_1 /TAXON_ID=283647 /ORGANISM="Mesodinium pulex, Strain SPMC105" /LENGTH=78 /DNA_ID=CAMNT_0004561049 /DNA_START=715 /DNA_END=951 /DNA_ORIENTATION=+
MAASDETLKGNLFTLSKLVNLKTLNLSSNKIQVMLLEEIYNIINAQIEGSESFLFNSLSDLDLSSNELTHIPDILELR